MHAGNAANPEGVRTNVLKACAERVESYSTLHSKPEAAEAQF